MWKVVYDLNVSLYEFCKKVYITPYLLTKIMNYFQIKI